MGADQSQSMAPLQTASPERVNQRRDGSVLDKISQFNSLSVAMQSRQLERKTADAALKRAMMGREEAEAEMRRLRDETTRLQNAVDEGRERERRVGERLESVMESYGRTKETYSHTQALWEKEIRRARKENFKTQSTIVKLQEELKTARSHVKVRDQTIEREKERVKAREKEAFTARYNMVGLQEQLDDARERIRAVEEERDAFKSHHVPESQEANGQSRAAKQESIGHATGRVSLSTMDIVSSAASEMEIEQLTTDVLWERQRADRAQEMVDFLQAECQMHCCPCTKSTAKKRRRESMEPAHDHGQAQVVKSRKEPRRSTIFLPQQGIFRTVVDPDEPDAAHPRHARTPSADPPALALALQSRSSLQSLLNAPHGAASHPTPLPTRPDPVALSQSPDMRPHSSATLYTVTTTVPLRADGQAADSSFADKLRTPSANSAVSFDLHNPALTPTMTREEALAKIRERRGRVRSAQNAATPAKPARGCNRREVSAPTGTTPATPRH
ncbi:hypothetical protein CDD82_41 [Ophiocordyceps australis]|uniref:Uncharacterized protein n=1 Tax=Ophiocordyceps australis TaxID=1399860 RepID=A0A2C5Y7K2_9HYPO|nr:hypothetical protein CDD82_41 [Ophiocordyceps australis]